MTVIGQVAEPARPIGRQATAAGPRAWGGGAAVAVAALLLAGPAPLLVKLGRSLWDREQYQFFPLMVIGAIAVAWERWQDLPRGSVRRGSAVAAGGLLGLALVVLVVASLLWVRSLALVATLFLLAGVVWRVGGASLLRTMGPSLVLLAILIPPPGHQESIVTLRLQHMAVSVSCRLMDTLGLPNVQRDSVIDIPGRRLLIEQACSGINSLMAVLAFTLLYGFYLRRSPGRLAVLLPGACLFVMGGNVIRITSEAWLLIRHGVDVTAGFSHMMLGLVLFGGCVALVASLDAVLGGNGQPMAPPRPATRPPAAARPPLIGWPAWAAGVIFAVAGAWTGARAWHAWLPPALPETAQFDLPPSIDGWQQVKTGAIFVTRPQTEAAQSTVWQFRRGDTFASVALDWPFVGYHELVICYSVSGWHVHSEAADPQGVTHVNMDQPDGDGYLLFSQVDEAGRPVTTPASLDLESLRGRIAGHLAIAKRTALSGPSYQMQVLMQSARPPTAEQRRAADELYTDVRRELTRQLLAQLGGAK